MEVTSITDGIIIDHVPAGTALKVLEYLRIDPARHEIALIMNAPSEKFGKKDIIKIEHMSGVNLDVLGLVARQATVDVIVDGKMIEKLRPTLPVHVTDVFKCANPRCVTTSERSLPQLFHLSHSQRQEYRCDYCDEEVRP